MRESFECAKKDFPTFQYEEFTDNMEKEAKEYLYKLSNDKEIKIKNIERFKYIATRPNAGLETQYSGLLDDLKKIAQRPQDKKIGELIQFLGDIEGEILKRICSNNQDREDEIKSQ